MKKACSLLIIICIFLNCSGCGGMRNQLRQLEQLVVVQTMGIDREDNGVRLTLASAAGEKKGAACLSNSGKTVAQALERLRSYSFEEELFCSHISHVLIGEDAAAEGIKNYLSYICHSPELRIDLPLYVVKGQNAEDLMTETGNSQKSITELLDALKSSLEHRGESSIFTAAEILGSMERSGCALICVLEYAEASEVPEEDSKALKTAAPYGYGILKDFRLVQFIDKDDAVGVGILLNHLGICDINVADPDGNSVTLELDNANCKVVPMRDEKDRLSGIRVQAKVSASIIEAAGGDMDLSSAEYTNYLVAQLETVLADRIGAVLALSKSLRADFLNLSSMLEFADPHKFREEVSDFSLLLPKLELQVSVKGKLSHTNDLKDA